MLGVFHLFKQKQSVTNGRQFRKTEGKTDAERLINAYWNWGNEKNPTLIAVRLAWTASEWTHVLYLVSQNHIEWLGLKGPVDIIKSNPWLKQVHLEQTAQVCVQVGFEYLQRKILHNILGSLFPWSVTLKLKKFFSIFRCRNFLHLIFTSCPASCHWTPLKRDWSHPLGTHL